MGPLADLIHPHRTWGLWVQLPLLLAVIAVTARDLTDASRKGGLSLPTIVAALTVTGLLLLWLPWESDAWDGHQGHYLELLRQLEPEVDSLERTLTFPVPAGLAWAFGLLLPDRVAEVVWLLANRLSLAVTLLALGGVAGHLVRSPNAARFGVLLGALAVPMLAWSTTAYAIVPAHACVALGLLLAVSGKPVGALAWVGLAMATRLECAVFVPIVAFLQPPGSWRADRGQSITALVVLGIELVLLLAKENGLPGWPVSDVALDNMGNIPLGGPWFSWPALALCGAAVYVARPLRGRMALVWGGGLLVSVLQTVTVLDLGARHFLPATLLIVPAVAAAVATTPRTRVSSALGLLVGVTVGIGALFELVDLRHQLVGEDPGVLPRWSRAADAGPRGALTELLDPACLVGVPGGSAVYPEAVDAFDIGIVREARFQLDEGRCVQWAVRPGTRFAGSTQLEFLDRVVRTLELEPVGWLELGDGRRWLLMESRP